MDILVEGVLVVRAGGSISGSNRIEIISSGTLINEGLIDIKDEVYNNGIVNNNGYIKSVRYIDKGYTCNTGTIEIDNGEKYKCHGCTLDCGGTIIACAIKMEEEGIDPQLSNQDICCDDGNDPTIEILDGTLDSATVTLCTKSLLYP